MFSPYSAKTVLPTSAGNDVWLRFTLAATTTPQSWIVRIPSVTVKKVSLYNLTPQSFWPVQSAGGSIAHSAWIRTTRTPSFEVVTRNVDTTFYLRFENDSPLTERPELMSQVDFADGASRVGNLLGLVLGMFGMLLLACGVVFALARSTVFISLAVFASAVLLHWLVQMGFASWRMWPDSVYFAQAIRWASPLVAVAAGSWFFAQEIGRASVGKEC